MSQEQSNNDGARTSEYYRTFNIPERFDNPVYPSRQVCYMPGNPIFSCVNPPSAISSNAYLNESEETFKGYSEKKLNPLYMTSNGAYGSKRPNVHTMPTVYHSRTTQFTEHLGKTGMFRNHSLNTATDKSKV